MKRPVLSRIRTGVLFFSFALLSVDAKLCRGWLLMRLVRALCRLLGVAKPMLDHRVQGGRYHPQTRRHIELSRFIQDTEVPKTSRILDAGCGPGRLISRLREVGYTEVEGCDCDEMPEAPFRYKLVDLNTQGLTAYPDCSFDVVIASDVLEHLENPAAALREIQRVLVPGGHAFITLPSCWNVYERTVFLLSGNITRYRVETPQRERSHISMLPEQILASLARRASLELVGFRSSYAFLFGCFWDGLKEPIFAYNLAYHYIRQ